MYTVYKTESELGKLYNEIKRIVDEGIVPGINCAIIENAKGII
jgi:hypothetical protein